MHDTALLPRPAPSRIPTAPRPLWMLAALAFGIAPLLAGLLFGEQLAAANTALTAALNIGEEERGTLHLSRIVLRFALPTVAALALLRFTGLGRWLVLTPATLALLLVADAFLVLYLTDQLSMYVLRGNGLLHELLRSPAAGGVALGSVPAATALLALATAWHRSPAWRLWLQAKARRWLREV